MFTALLLLLASLFTAGGGDPDPEPANDPEPDTQDDPEPDDDEPAGSGGDDPGLDGDFDPERAMSTIRKQRAIEKQLRDELKAIRSQAEEQNAVILKALGVTPDDEEPDLSSEVQRLATENKLLRLRQDFTTLAEKLGANARLTWAYLVAEGQIDDLDPASPNFAETLTERATKAIEAEPGLKSATVRTPPAPGPTDLDSPTPPAEDPADMSMSQFMEWRKKNRNKE